MLDTGFPRADVENEFLRARRRQVLAALAHRLRRQPRRCDRLLTLDGILGALGRRGQRRLGLQTIRLDTIVGTASSRRDFDRRFRPTTNRVRFRWEQLALAERRGAARRGDPADRGVPRRPPALRQRRPSPGINSRRDRPAGNRRLRDRGTHHRCAVPVHGVNGALWVLKGQAGRPRLTPKLCSRDLPQQAVTWIGSG
ncbi:MAG TPA: hypothetical protein VGH77_13515 [Streptosporangiaceae bacterium]